MQKQEQNYAFIDSQNVNLAIRSQGWQLDFARFRVYLRDKYQVSKAFLFIGYVAGNESRYTKLQEQGYIQDLRVCPFLSSSGEPKARPGDPEMLKYKPFFALDSRSPIPAFARTVEDKFHGNDTKRVSPIAINTQHF